LGVVNADKPPLDADEVRRRLRQFVWQGDVWLTRQPTFLGKSGLFPGTAFVVGHDTAVRVVGPRFYGGDEAMRAALRAIRGFGCRFLVAGRTDGSGRFLTVHHVAVPDEWKGLFAGLSEADFRADVSSTIIRTRQPTDLP
jgi:hypothetical protein